MEGRNASSAEVSYLGELSGEAPAGGAGAMADVEGMRRKH